MAFGRRERLNPEVKKGTRGNRGGGQKVKEEASSSPNGDIYPRTGNKKRLVELREGFSMGGRRLYDLSVVLGVQGGNLLGGRLEKQRIVKNEGRSYGEIRLMMRERKTRGGKGEMPN